MQFNVKSLHFPTTKTNRPLYIYENRKHLTRSLALTPFNLFQTKSTNWPLINYQFLCWMLMENQHRTHEWEWKGCRSCPRRKKEGLKRLRNPAKEERLQSKPNEKQKKGSKPSRRRRNEGLKIKHSDEENGLQAELKWWRKWHQNRVE